MQESTNDRTTYVSPLFNVEQLNHPSFLNGFSDGIDAYELECERVERLLTVQEVCRTISEELEPPVPERVALLQWAAEFCDYVQDPLVTAGWLAGWIYAALYLKELPQRKGSSTL